MNILKNKLMEQALLKAAKSDYLLDAPLEILHEESLEWLEDIKFWKDEITFFFSILSGKFSKANKVDLNEIKKIEKQIVHISVAKLDDMRAEVLGHEKYLSKIMSDMKQDMQLYRLRHKDIGVKFEEFKKEFKVLKIKIFDIAKKYN